MKIIFSILLGLYLFICLFMYVKQKELLYFPQTEDRNYTKQFAAAEINFEFDSETVHGWMQIKQVDSSNPLIIYYGGNGEEVSHNQVWFKQLGIKNYVLLNYRGYGRSTGVPTESVLKEDALRVFDFLSQDNNIEPSSIVLIGRSLGTGLATYIASEREVRQVVLITPYDSLVNVAKTHYPILPVSLLMNQRFESNILAPEIEEPVLCLIAENDQIIPPDHAQKICKAWKGETSVSVIQGSNHNTIASRPEFYRLIQRFIH